MSGRGQRRNRIGAVKAVTPLGWAVVVVGLVTGIVAYRLAWFELVVASAGLLVLVVVAVASTLGSVSLAVSIDASATRATVGDRLTGAIQIRNKRRRTVLGLRMEVPVGRSVARFNIRRLKGGDIAEELFVIPTTRRGVIDLGPAVSVKGDPLGLIRRPYEWTGVERIHIHPATARLRPLRDGRVSDLDGQPSSQRSASDLAFHSLREYVVGDDLRHVHWRSSARHGDLMVRQFDDTRRSHVLVILSGEPADYRHQSEFELAVSMAATVAKRVQTDQQGLTVVVGQRELPTASAVGLLDRWSEVELDAAEPSDGIALARRVAVGATTVVYCTGSAVEHPRLRGRLRTADWHAEAFILIAAPDAAARYRETEEGAVMSIPNLDIARANLGRVLG